jgi:hypothetical protein
VNEAYRTQNVHMWLRACPKRHILNERGMAEFKLQAGRNRPTATNGALAQW